MASLRTLEGPVELIDGTLSLRIPRALVEPGIVALLSETSQGDDTSLTVRIPDGVATSLELTAGSMVAVDNRGGEFSITRAADAGPSEWRVTSRRYAPFFTLGSWAVFAKRDDQP